MSIILEIDSETEAQLQRQAAAEGIDIASYATSLLQNALRPAPKRGLLTKEDLQQTVSDMTVFSDRMPILPDEALSRQRIYNIR